MSTDTTAAPEPQDEPPGDGAEVFDLDEERRRRTEPPEDGDGAEPQDEREPPGESEPVIPVDPADLPEVDRIASMLAAKRRAILPEWARSYREARAAARVVTGHYLHVVGFHAVRAPLVYTPRLLARCPRGFGRVLRSAGAWLGDAEGRPARVAAVARDDADTYLKLSRQRNDRVKARAALFLPVLLTLIAAALYLALFAAVLAQVAALFAAALAFGALGAPADKPLIGQAVVKSKVVKLTSDIVVRALGSLGIAGINKALASKEGIAFPSRSSATAPASAPWWTCPTG